VTIFQSQESSAAEAGGASPDMRNVRVVVVRSSSTAGRFPGTDTLSTEGRLASCAGAEVKPWKSYSSLEQALLVPSSRSVQTRDFHYGRNKTAAVASSSRRAPDEELKVVRDDRKLSLTIPGEEYRSRVQFAPRGSCQL